MVVVVSTEAVVVVVTDVVVETSDGPEDVEEDCPEEFEGHTRGKTVTV